VSFAGVLWILSGEVTFTLDHTNYFTIPGYMLWCALLYSAAGSWLAWLVGRPLIRLNAERYAREADLRSALVRVHESAEAIALHGGESDERRTLGGSTTDVISLGRQLANGLARLTWITSGYGWLALVVPALAALPGYMYGNLSLGGLTMVVGAFTHVQSALRWFVDNFHHIADWRATLLQVVRFRDGLLNLNTPTEDAERIAVGRHPPTSSPSRISAFSWPMGARRSIGRWSRSIAASACSSPVVRTRARASCCARSRVCGRRAPARSCRRRTA
jgi:putative ATP-binding cassette transporter